MTVARIAWRVSLLVALAVGGTPLMAQAQPAPPPGVPAPTRSEDPLSSEAARIRHLLDAGQGEEAAFAARAFARMVADEAGFGIANARLTAAPATGYGVFTPRADHVYAVNEPVFAYVELYGFSLTPQPGGANALVFDVSFTLDTPDGRQMTDAMIPMGEIRLSSHSEPLDAYFHLTYSITGAEGPYSLRTRVVDRASGETAEFALPLEFHVEAPHDADEDKGN